MNTTDIWSTFLTGVLLPVIAAIFAYVVVSLLGEWQKRKASSRIGVAIIEALQEEVRTGIETMTAALQNAEDPNANGPLLAAPPRATWSGMSTIPDDVLLRILAISANRNFGTFKPRDCRRHCKNYFEHMCTNYEARVQGALTLAMSGQDWRVPILSLLREKDRNGSSYIWLTKQVDEMLEHTRQLLDDNSKALIPN